MFCNGKHRLAGGEGGRARRVNAVLPLRLLSTFLSVENPQTFRREQAPTLRYAVYLCACRGGYQPPANVAIGTMSPGRANGMIRRCIHSLSLGLWPIQLPRRGSLGYVLLFLALSYLYRHTPNRRTQFAPTARGQPFCLWGIPKRFGGSKPPPYGVRFICLPVENVAFGTISHDGTTGTLRKKPPEIFSGGFFYFFMVRTITAFWAWRRFSASSKISAAWASKTSSVISSPLWAGRQWRTIASGFATLMSFASTQ